MVFVSSRGASVAALVLVAGGAIRDYRNECGSNALPRGSHPGVSALVTTSGRSSSTTGRRSMWEVMEYEQQKQASQSSSTSETSPSNGAWRVIFGERGERGEYMDGYSEKAMNARCVEDYLWETTPKATATAPSLGEERDESAVLASERAKMMAHLYDHGELWKHTCMVAFAEHYVLVDKSPSAEGTLENSISKPYDTFRHQKASRPMEEPIFAGVVWEDWERDDESSNSNNKLDRFGEHGIDYVRIHCNLQAITDPAQLSPGDPATHTCFGRLAAAARECQLRGMVPLVLLQVRWREPENHSLSCYRNAMASLAAAFRAAKVDPTRVLLETRPPIGLSAKEEATALTKAERIALGQQTGRTMFGVLNEAFGGAPIAGFCVAGGSTKGMVPTAMEDDTQNAVRQGIRESAREMWGYDVCFWEMGAKLMLQPAVGRLWCDQSGDRRDAAAARELFGSNARDLAEEIVQADPC